MADINIFLGTKIYPQIPDANYKWSTRNIDKRSIASLFGAEFDALRVDRSGNVYTSEAGVPTGFISLEEIERGGRSGYVSLKTLFERVPTQEGGVHLQFKEEWQNSRIPQALARNAGDLASATEALVDSNNPRQGRSQYLSTFASICQKQVDIFRAAREFESERTKERLGAPIRWKQSPAHYLDVKTLIEDVFGEPVAEILISRDGVIKHGKKGASYESLIPFLECGMGGRSIRGG